MASVIRLHDIKQKISFKITEILISAIQLHMKKFVLFLIKITL